jgi:hypothetical protein
MVKVVYNNTRAITNKWPGMIVKGDSVTPEQAAEILIKTDTSFPDFKYAGNDQEFASALNEITGIPIDRTIYDDYSKVYALAEKCGVMRLSYLDNQRIYSSWVGGPNGWCDWNGTIFSNNKNIGKWPDVEAVATDWKRVLEAFPYLNLVCQLFDAETCEEHAKPLVEFHVGDGVVRVEDSDEPLDTFSKSWDIGNLLALGRERGITVNKLKEKIEQVYGYIPQMEN